MRRAVFVTTALVSACGGSGTLTLSTPLVGTDGGVVTVGTPCTPAQENLPMFGGFDLGEVSVESSSGQPSGGAVCIAYHFQGRVSCPYGQSSTSQASSCSTPEGQPVTASVPPQCLDRRAAGVVVWSCRCANVHGATDDGSTYCECPSGTTCTQSVVAIGADPGNLTGAYCLPTTAFFDAAHACSAQCDPVAHPCH